MILLPLALSTLLSIQAHASDRADALAELTRTLQTTRGVEGTGTPGVLVGITGVDADRFAEDVRTATDPSTVRVLVLDPAKEPSVAIDKGMKSSGADASTEPRFVAGYGFLHLSAVCGVTVFSFLPFEPSFGLGFASPWLTAAANIEGGPVKPWGVSIPGVDIDYILGVEGFVGLLDSRRGKGIGPAMTTSRIYKLGSRWPWNSSAVGVMWSRRFLLEDSSRFLGFAGLGFGSCDGPGCDVLYGGLQLRLEWFLKNGLHVRAEVAQPKGTITLGLGYSWGVSIPK